MQPNFNLQREIKNELVCGISKSSVTPFHFHSHIEFYIVLYGKIEVIVNDKRKILQGGEFSVALSYDAHSYRALGDAKAIYLIIPQSYVKDFTDQLMGRREFFPFIDDPETVKTVTDAASKLILGGNELTRRGLIFLILGAILDKLPKDESPHLKPHAPSPEILIYVSNHFREEMSLATVAKEFGYSASYLSRMFSETFGISFKKYLTLTRLREAVLLLQSADMSITECAMESGFSSMRSFYRAFRDEFATTPKEYYANIRKN